MAAVEVQTATPALTEKDEEGVIAKVEEVASQVGSEETSPLPVTEQAVDESKGEAASVEVTSLGDKSVEQDEKIAADEEASGEAVEEAEPAVKETGEETDQEPISEEAEATGAEDVDDSAAGPVTEVKDEEETVEKPAPVAESAVADQNTE